jgi:hypothetical protein
MSLGRLGLDFRHWIVDQFEENLVKLVALTLQDGTDAFVERLSLSGEYLQLSSGHFSPPKDLDIM